MKDIERRLRRAVKAILSSLKHVRAVQIDTKEGGGFLLKIHEKEPAAPKSPIFINIRTADNPKPGPLTQDHIWIIGEILWLMAQKANLQFDGVVGLPRAGEPFAKVFRTFAARAFGKHVPLLTLEKQELGGKRRISRVKDGAGLQAGSVVLVIDDLITFGGTKDEGIEALNAAGYKVRDILVFLDREQGGARAHLAEKGIMLTSAVGMQDMLDFYRQNGVISDAEYEVVSHYLSGQKTA